MARDMARTELAIAAADYSCDTRLAYRLWDKEAWAVFYRVLRDDKTALAYARKLKWEADNG